MNVTSGSPSGKGLSSSVLAGARTNDTSPAAKQLTDFASIKREALNRVESVLQHYLPGGEWKGDEYVVRNPKRNDQREGNFKINRRKDGVWSDFATGETGGDLISLVAFIKGLKQGEAAKDLAQFLGIEKSGVLGVAGVAAMEEGTGADFTDKRSGTPEEHRKKVGVADGWKPVPEDAPPRPDEHSKLGRPSHAWEYHDREGRIVGYQYRFDVAGGEKEFRPLSFIDGKWKWSCQDGSRPIYGLRALTLNPTAPVLLCEGEKAADAAALLLPEFMCVTTMSGALSPHKSDLSVFSDRDLLIWPDNDEAGRKYARLVARLAIEYGAKRVRIVRVENIPLATEKFDLADCASHGLDDAWVRKILATPELLEVIEGRTKSEIIDCSPADESSERTGFKVDSKGVWFVENEPGEDPKRTWICSELRIEATVSDERSESHGRLLIFKDNNATVHKWCMPVSTLPGEDFIKILLDKGLLVNLAPRAKNLLRQYLQMYTPKQRALCATKTGWHPSHRCYVLPSRTIGNSDATILYQSESIDPLGFEEKGSSEDWRTEVGEKCKGNSRLVFATCVAFAAPVLHLIDEESGGFHFRGASSIGKSTALLAAGSVYGAASFIRSWRGTDNGLEATAALRNDCLLLLDEMGACNGLIVGEVVYLLQAGKTKQRANRTGAARSCESFRLLFLSTGEISLADHMRSSGKRSHAGQELRIADIPADCGMGLGLFENIGNSANGDAFARELKESVLKAHGTAGPAFIECLAADFDDLPEAIRFLRDDFVRQNVPELASGQAQRVAGRFGLVAAAGELATAYGITGWDPGDANEAVAKCFKAWLDARGGAGEAEPKAILSQVRLFFEQHGASRFTFVKPTGNVPDEYDERTINRAGYKRKGAKGMEYLVFPETFQEICSGHDYKTAARVLVDAGWLRPGHDGKSSRSETIEGHKRRLYVFGEKEMFEESPDSLATPENT